jgi:D-alanyl-D-alanine carboxypeptidase
LDTQTGPHDPPITATQYEPTHQFQTGRPRYRRALPARRRRVRAWAITIPLIVLAIVSTALVLRPGFHPSATAPISQPAPVGPQIPASTPRAPRDDDQNSYSIVVDKLRPLRPLDYVPADLVPVTVPFIGQRPYLRAKAATAVEALFAAFHTETGQQMQSNSAYRSYDEQKQELARFSEGVSESEALDSVARPGYSEHQTGLAIDIGAFHSSCITRECFAGTTQAHWLAVNAWRFGFIIRYPRDEQALTGYTYEPWHIRYVGLALAKAIHGHYPSLESYFGLPPAPNYE